MSCNFSACCIASCEPVQIHGGISKIQKKIWNSRYEKRGVYFGFCACMRINSMRGSRNFCQGGSRPDGQKTAWTTFFSVCFFWSSTYFTVYRRGPMVILQRKLYFSKDPEGVEHFPGGPASSAGRGGGPSAYLYRTPYNLWFSRGSGTPIPPPPPPSLWIRTWSGSQ